MQLNVSKRPILAILVLVGLAAATVVVAGYVDKPGQTAQVAAQDKCSACPRQGTEDCCKSPCQACPLKGTDACCQKQCDNCPRQDTEACCQAKAGESGDINAYPAPGAEGTCAAMPAGCGGANAQASGCPMSAGPGPAPSSCGAMRCPRAE
jgi:hypothetical protein